MHRGVDFAHKTPGKDYSGASIFAMEDGVVVEGSDRASVSGFGNWVWLRHIIDGQVVDTIYGHVYRQDITVKKGDLVARGQRIAKVGNNGDSSSAHLHAEVWRGGRTDGIAVDPVPWMES